LGPPTLKLFQVDAQDIENASFTSDSIRIGVEEIA